MSTLTTVTDLDEYRRARDASPTKLAIVLTDVDPHNPDHAWHLVVHETREAVESQVRGLFAGVEAFGNGGEAHCHGIGRREGRYFAIVETVRFPDLE